MGAHTSLSQGRKEADLQLDSQLPATPSRGQLRACGRGCCVLPAKPLATVDRQKAEAGSIHADQGPGPARILQAARQN